MHKLKSGDICKATTGIWGFILKGKRLQIVAPDNDPIFGLDRYYRMQVLDPDFLTCVYIKEADLELVQAASVQPALF